MNNQNHRPESRPSMSQKDRKEQTGDGSEVRERPCRIEAALGAEHIEYCAGHSESECRLAEAAARAIHGPDATPEQASWFLEDADSIAGWLGQHASWTVVTNVDEDGRFTVNGVLFEIDWNAEGNAPADLAVPKDLVCPACGEAAGGQTMGGPPDGVEIECGGCFDVHVVPRWWTSDVN